MKQIMRGRHESDRVVEKHGLARGDPKQAEAGSAWANHQGSIDDSVTKTTGWPDLTVLCTSATASVC